MAIVTRTVLKTYFETGDTPTQAQFIDLIDTLFSLAAGETNQPLSDVDFQEEISVAKRSKSGSNAITYALTVSVNFALADIHNISTVTGNLTINTTGVETGQTGAITFTIDATGGYTIASGTGTWKKLDNSALDFADCNIASTEYLVFYIIKGTTIYYSIDSVTP